MPACVHGPDLSGGDDKPSKIQSCVFQARVSSTFVNFMFLELGKLGPRFQSFGGAWWGE